MACWHSFVLFTSFFFFMSFFALFPLKRNSLSLRLTPGLEERQRFVGIYLSSSGNKTCMLHFIVLSQGGYSLLSVLVYICIYIVLAMNFHKNNHCFNS